MRDLVADMHREMLAPLVPQRDEPARLDRQVREPALVELAFDHLVRFALPGGEVPRREALYRNDIRGQRLVYFRRIFGKSLREIRRRRQRLVNDLHAFGRVLGEIARLRDHARHGIAVKAYLVDRQRGHLDRQQTLDRRRHAQRQRPLRELLAGVDRYDAGRLVRLLQVDATDPRVRMRRAHEAGVQGAWDLDVVDVAPVPGEQAPVFLAQERRADVAQLRSSRLHRGSL